jgi:dTDP-4-dehydrorhamnose 3,5-epimerase
VPRFEFFETSLSGLFAVNRTRTADQRGFLSRIYCADEFRTAGMHKSISQINHTMTRQTGTVRGMHFQRPPFAEIKVVSCLKGEVFDVAVDLRRDSPTFLRWHGEILSADNERSLLIPEGFAHGFQTLTADCELVYLHTAAYHPELEEAVNVADSSLNIRWPLEIQGLSDRDRGHPFLHAGYRGIEL